MSRCEMKVPVEHRSRTSASQSNVQLPTSKSDVVPGEKRKFDAGLARVVANGLVEKLQGACLANGGGEWEPMKYLTIAGSLRREKAQVGDVEILYVPRIEPRLRLCDFFECETNLATEVIEGWLREGKISKRLNCDGGETWGEQNKLGVHAATGVPVDFFATRRECWWNYLVCRTGPAESNTRIATEARRRGWKWEPYSNGFAAVDSEGDPTGERHLVMSEREVFEFVGLEYREPRDR